jgi:hypothetical protein
VDHGARDTFFFPLRFPPFLMEGRWNYKKTWMAKSCPRLFFVFSDLSEGEGGRGRRKMLRLVMEKMEAFSSSPNRKKLFLTPYLLLFTSQYMLI